MIRALALAAAVLATGCASQVQVGLRLFAGCPDGVDEQATRQMGSFVCRGERDPRPFDGNGRSCGDCHVPGDGFAISPDRIRTLPADHPLFTRDLDENLELLRSHGLFRVVVPPEIREFRQTPKLTHLQSLCDEDGNCGPLGLRGDRVRNLCVFSMQAVANHMSRSVERVPGRDFRALTSDECAALVAYMLSDLVADPDSR